MRRDTLRERLFGDRTFNENLTRLTFPIAFQSLMLASVAAADAVMLGRLSQNSMAAVSLATQIQFVQNMFLGSVTAAGGILGAQYWGKGDKGTVGEIFAMMLRLNGLISLVFFLGCVCTPELLMRCFTSDPVLLEIGVGYLRIAGWSYLLSGISQSYLMIMKVSERAGRSAWISSGAVVLNIVLNAVLIFGLLGLPGMDARGAALATLLARTVELVWAVASSLQKGFIRLEPRRLLHRSVLLMRDFYACAIPLLGGGLVWGVGFTSYTAVMGHLGSDAAAANSVAAVVRDLMCCLCNGIASAGGILVGNELGRGELERGRLYGDRLMHLSWFIGLFSTFVVLAVTPFVQGFVRLSPEAHSYLTAFMVLMAVYMIGRCVNTVTINGVFAAGGDTVFDVYSNLACMWAIAIPVTLIAAFILHLPAPVVYFCTCVDEVGKLPWVMAHYKKYKWVKDLTR